MPRTARQAFLENAALPAFKGMVTQAAFDVACEHALLVFSEESTLIKGNPNDLWGSHERLIGAKRALEILRTLHLPEEPDKPMKTRSVTAPK